MNKQELAELRARMNKRIENIDSSLGRMDGILNEMAKDDLEGMAKNLLNENMKLIAREDRKRVQQADQFASDLRREERELQHQEAEWAREDTGK